MVFEAIDQIVFEDTGGYLIWRHLHASSPTEFIGILELAVDQHGGQALGKYSKSIRLLAKLTPFHAGLGMYLVRVARRLPLRADLHESGRLIQDLDEYDHLRRFLRLCENHFFRNILKAQVPDYVRSDMRSLVCIEHQSWDATLKRIETVGGKAGKGQCQGTPIFSANPSRLFTDWLNDKVRAKFVFPAICWEKSFIPREVWQVGDRTTNIIESVHYDVNQEGISCTLVGGLKKGEDFDRFKLTTLKVGTLLRFICAVSYNCDYLTPLA